ncbi:MAG TPA: ABC transporter substrate-binding protein [Candidatus Binatia bacterium]|nr:ABC transporter substrate-binding protein [Candidatus Binatia bacterium]
MLLVLRAQAIGFLPFYIAEEKGFFRDQGVSIRYVHSHEDKKRMVELVLEGEVAFYATISVAVESLLRGWGEMRALCATSVSRYPCAARSEIKSLAELKGKKVMVGGGRSMSEVLWLCHRYNWELGKDLHVVRGDLSERSKAFFDSSFSAVFGRPQYLFWLKKGGFHLLPYPDPGRAWPEAGVTTSLRLIQENPEAVQRVVNAVVLATEYLKHDRDAAVEIALKNVPYLDREAAEGNYDVLRDWYSSEVSESAIAHLTEVHAVATKHSRVIKLEEVADLSFLRNAVALKGTDQ